VNATSECFQTHLDQISFHVRLFDLVPAVWARFPVCFHEFAACWTYGVEFIATCGTEPVSRLHFVSTDRTFSILLVHEECIVASLELENVIVQLVRHVVVQGQRVADQKVYDQWQQPEADHCED